MLEERWAWIGLGAIVAASVAFANKAINVLRGNEPRRALFDELLQDGGLVCLGIALMFDKGTSPRIFFLLGFVVIFGSYAARRMWSYRQARREGRYLD